jgi:hypothetical protein
LFAQSRIELIIADSFDRASLDAMVARTGVVLSTVGPFFVYGDALVQVGGWVVMQSCMAVAMARVVCEWSRL